MALALVGATTPTCLALAQTSDDATTVQASTRALEQIAYEVQVGQSEQLIASARRMAAKAKASVLTTGQKAVKISKQYIGVPYVYAGATPSGFDCSGFTMYVYSKLDIKLSHNAQAQFSEGSYVQRGSLKAGDLVFFGGSNGSIRHVGMYVGKGKYIHSPQPGLSVTIADLSQRADYVGACRPA